MSSACKLIYLIDIAESRTRSFGEYTTNKFSKLKFLVGFENVDGPLSIFLDGVLKTINVFKFNEKFYSRKTKPV